MSATQVSTKRLSRFILGRSGRLSRNFSLNAVWRISEGFFAPRLHGSAQWDPASPLAATDAQKSFARALRDDTLSQALRLDAFELAFAFHSHLWKLSRGLHCDPSLTAPLKPLFVLGH